MGERVRVNFPVTILAKSSSPISQQISAIPGALLLVDPTANFDGATLDIDVLFRPHAKARVINGLTVNRKATMQGGLNLTELNFEGSQTLSGAGEIFMPDENLNTTHIRSTSGTLTIGPEMTIRGSGHVGATGVPLINEGMIISTLGGYAAILVTGSTVENRGALIADRSSVIVSDNFRNTGTIQLLNGRMELAGTYTTEGLGRVEGENGVVNLSGTLTKRTKTSPLQKTSRGT
jgi:hypothetical protein